MSDRMSEDMPCQAEWQEIRKTGQTERTSEDGPERMSGDVPERMSGRRPEDVPAADIFTIGGDFQVAMAKRSWSCGVACWEDTVKFAQLLFGLDVPPQTDCHIHRTFLFFYLPKVHVS